MCLCLCVVVLLVVVGCLGSEPAIRTMPDAADAAAASHEP